MAFLNFQVLGFATEITFFKCNFFICNYINPVLNARKQCGLLASFWKFLNFLLEINRRHWVLFCRFPNEFTFFFFFIDTTLNKNN